MKKIRLDVSVLLPSMNLVKSVIMPKNTMPILDNVLFATNKEDGNLVLNLVGSDGNTWISQKVLDGIDGDDGIMACLNAENILNSMRNLGTCEVSMCFDEAKHVVICTYPNGSFTMPFSDGMEYPRHSNIEDAQSAMVNPSTISKAIHAVSYATANDELRLVLTGIYMSLSKDNGLSIVATDGRKLAIYKDTLAKFGSDIDNAFILPCKAANLLSSITSHIDEGKEIFVRSTGEKAAFEYDTFLMVTRLIDGRYPNYSAVMPKAFSKKAIVDRQKLVDAIRRVRPLGDNNAKLLKATFDSNSIQLNTEDIDMETSATENVSCEYYGDRIEIGFQADFLLEVAKSMNSDNIAISLNECQLPVMFEPVGSQDNGTQHTTILMPLKI